MGQPHVAFKLDVSSAFSFAIFAILLRKLRICAAFFVILEMLRVSCNYTLKKKRSQNAREIRSFFL